VRRIVVLMSVSLDGRVRGCSTPRDPADRRLVQTQTLGNGVVLLRRVRAR